MGHSKFEVTGSHPINLHGTPSSIIIYWKKIGSETNRQLLENVTSGFNPYHIKIRPPDAYNQE